VSGPVDVNVNPSSATQASSGATSGGGGLVFSFGPNPNLGFLNTSNGAATVPRWALLAGVAAAGLILWKLFR